MCASAAAAAAAATAVRSPRASSAWRTSWRYEYYAPRGAPKGAPADATCARAVLAPLRESRPALGERAGCINVPDKGRDGRGAVAATARALIEAGADPAEVVPHFSCKTMGGAGGRNAACHDRLAEFLGELSALGIERALVVTGSGERPVGSLEALREHARRQQKSSATGGGPKLHVAFNPYEPALDGELDRLRAKLSTGVVAGVWLQLGSDPEALRRGLEQLEAIARDEQAPKLELYGSVLMPSKQLLARFRFRPWVGVRFSDEYLTDVDAARGITRAVLQVYEAHGVTPLWESRINTGADADDIQGLMDEAADASAPAAGSPAATAGGAAAYDGGRRQPKRQRQLADN